PFVVSRASATVNRTSASGPRRPRRETVSRIARDAAARCDDLCDVVDRAVERAGARGAARYHLRRTPLAGRVIHGPEFLVRETRERGAAVSACALLHVPRSGDSGFRAQSDEELVQLHEYFAHHVRRPGTGSVESFLRG